MNTNLSRFRSQSLQDLLDIAQDVTSQNTKTYKLQKKEFKTCQVRPIERTDSTDRKTGSAEFN